MSDIGTVGGVIIPCVPYEVITSGPIAGQCHKWLAPLPVHRHIGTKIRLVTEAIQYGLLVKIIHINRNFKV